MSDGFLVQKKQCSTCIYRKNNPLNIKVLDREIADPYMEGEFKGYRICHHSNEVCCRGFWNRHKNHFNLGRIAQRLGVVRFVSVDTLKNEE